MTKLANCHDGTSPSAAMPWMAPVVRPRSADKARAQWRGRNAAHAGRAAEEIVMRQYLRSGAVVLEERWRCAGGEIDLIVRQGDELVFVEVKQRRNLHAWDSPVSPRQWQRLEAAANQYILEFQADTGIHPICRFDVALVGHDGVAQIIENAWSCLS